MADSDPTPELSTEAASTDADKSAAENADTASATGSDKGSNDDSKKAADEKDGSAKIETSSAAAKTEKSEKSEKLESTKSADSPDTTADSASNNGAKKADTALPLNEEPELTSAEKLQAHHVSKILDEVLVDSAAASSSESYKHPMLLDLALALGLLLAMGGCTIGLAKIYITHSAQQSILQHNYKAALAILKNAPFPGMFNMPGSDAEELLNQVYYLDANDKLDANGEDESALKELEKIRPGSIYFDMAQTVLKEHFRPSQIQLQGTAEHQATPQDKEIEKQKPILPEVEKTGSP